GSGQRGGARSTVRLNDLLERLVRYRNREFGHGAVGQRSEAFYGRVARSLFAGIPELLGRLGTAVGHQLLYIDDVKREHSGEWLLEWLTLWRVDAAARQPTDASRGRGTATAPRARLSEELSTAAPSAPRLTALHPLVIYAPETRQRQPNQILTLK